MSAAPLRSLWCLLLMLMFGCISLAQIPDLKFITYTTNDNLLHNYTKKCIEDKKGFLWVVSQTGLSRFDGVQFKNFQHHDDDSLSLPHNLIYDIDVDRKNRIWLATESGLCFYSEAVRGFTKINIPGTFINSPAVEGLAYDASNQVLWFMTDKALYRCNTTDLTITPTTCLKPATGKINQLYLSSNQKIWIALNRAGYIMYDIASDRSETPNSESWVTRFYEGKDSVMWIGHWQSDHLVGYDMKTGISANWKVTNASGTRENLIVSGMTTVPFFGDSILWISTQHLGIQLFNMNQKKFVGEYYRDSFMKFSLPADFTNDIYTDSKGIVWICTWNGLCKMNMAEQQFRTLEIPFLNTPLFQYYNLIEGIVAGDEPGTWWLGVNGCGVIKYDTASRKMLRQWQGNLNSDKLNIASGSWIEFIIRDSKGRIWAGSEIGISRIENDRVEAYDMTINGIHHWKKTICVAPDETFWLSTATHLIHFDPNTTIYTAYEIDPILNSELPIQRVIESSFDGMGKLWCGTMKGLYGFDTKTHQSQHVSLSATGFDSAAVNTIYSLTGDGNETLYLGTSVGLGIYHIPSGQLEIKGHGDEVYPILWKSLLRDEQGDLWIYTDHALFRYQPEKDLFSVFTTAQGIHNFSSDPTHLFSFQNKVYIGYRGTLTEFDPLKVDENQAQVKPVITEFWIGDVLQTGSLDSFSQQNMNIPAGSRDITLYFTGIDFTNSDKITFRYRLKEESTWTEAGTNRMVNYARLAQGSHIFQLQGRNSSGILSEEIGELHFYLQPTLTQRKWFWPLIALIFILLVTWIANFRIRRIRKIEQLKTETNNKMAQLEMKWLRSQMNPHFIFNSLNSIQKYIWENKEEDAAEYLARFAKLIRAILENSSKEYISLREELAVLKLYIELEHRRSNGKFDYRIQMDEHIDDEGLAIPPLLLQPYVENSIWHGVNKKQGHGQITITIREKNDLLEFCIDDDGVGRNFNAMETTQPTRTTAPIGMNITAQRIQQLQNKSSVIGVRIVDKQSDGLPSGTTVIVTLPVKLLKHAEMLYSG